MTDLQLNLQGVYYLTCQFETFALCISNIEEKFECGTPARFSDLFEPTLLDIKC